MLIPVYLCYTIWEYVGNKAIFLNKDLLTLINLKKKEFIDNPLLIKFRLAKFKEGRSNRSSRYRRRPSVLVEKWEELKLNGEYKINSIDSNGKIIPSDDFKDSLIPVSEAKAIYDKNLDFDYYYKVIYWEFYEMHTEDIERGKLYKMLFNSYNL